MAQKAQAKKHPQPLGGSEQALTLAQNIILVLLAQIVVCQKRGVDDSTEAGNGTRTRDLLLGKQALYQLSYTRKLAQL